MNHGTGYGCSWKEATSTSAVLTDKEAATCMITYKSTVLPVNCRRGLPIGKWSWKLVEYFCTWCQNDGSLRLTACGETKELFRPSLRRSVAPQNLRYEVMLSGKWSESTLSKHYCVRCVPCIGLEEHCAQDLQKARISESSVVSSKL